MLDNKTGRELQMHGEIPKRFIRIWVGPKPIPDQFEEWWEGFQTIHPTYEFHTVRDIEQLDIPSAIKPMIQDVKTCAGLSDIGRLLALHQLGGVYVDTDIMPLKSFDELIKTDKVFIGKASKKSFYSAVIGSPPNHEAIGKVIDKMPSWFYEHATKAASVQTGPTFVTSVLFGRDDVLHLPMETFYPYSCFMAPKRHEKEQIFADRNFPDEMVAAHFGNHRWGGKPR
tara:strand:- start:358 stop:1038 length:681 start_codon:yes stop_codon:yes gene_type:complete